MFGIHRGGVLSLPDRSGAIEPSAAVSLLPPRRRKA
jgi:hypothetical protein